MISSLINKPCTLLVRTDGREDAHGNAEQDETAVAAVCELQQRRRDEPALQNELSVTEWDAFFPAGTVAHTGDGLLVDGAEYEFVGDPWPVRNPRSGAISHVEATVRRSAASGDLS